MSIFIKSFGGRPITLADVHSACTLSQLEDLLSMTADEELTNLINKRIREKRTGKKEDEPTVRHGTSPLHPELSLA